MSKYLKEFFSHYDVFILCLFFSAGVVMTVPRVGEGRIWLAAVVGCVLFAVSEYLTHRFFFHLKPPKNRTLLQLLKRLHYDHHEDPDNLKLLFLPVWYTAPQFLLIGTIAFLISGNAYVTISFVTGAMGYQLYYEWKHYVAHRPIKPLTPWGRMLKKYHLLHHFKSEHYWYGVTNPVMDRLLGTMKDEKEAEKSQTARKLL